MARAPVIFTEIVDVNSDTIALTGDEKILIKYHSDAKATMNPFVYDGASINLDTLVMRNGNQKAYGSEIPFSHTFRNVSSNEFIFSCEDSNNMTGTAKVTADMIDYVKPTCYIHNAVIGGNGKITIQCSGTCFNDTFGAVSNEVAVRCRCTAQGESAYTAWWNMNVTQSENSYAASLTITKLNYEKNYVFQVEVEDKLETIRTTKIISSVPIFHWGKNDFAFEVPVSMPSLEIGGASIEHGEWEPILNGVETISSQREVGWYIKVGNTVTIGFNIKVECDSGYHNTLIKIGGLPFVPYWQSAGGGMCSGAYVSGSNNFQCFVAEENGLIATRVQDCEHYDNENLSTSASGCFYPYGGGELTLSGTITYLTNE